MTNTIAEVQESECLFVIGTNTTENHPVIGSMMKQAHEKGAKLIVADPRRIELADYADVYMQIQPGTNIALINSMMHVIVKEELYDEEYIDDRTENFEKLVELVEDYTPERAAEICGIDPEDIVKAARIYGQSKDAGIYYAMGITQHTTGTHGVMSISNLALMCGNVGNKFGGVNPLRGQNNVQGACDMGGLPADLPGYQKVFKPEIKEKFEEAWDVELSDEVGLTIPEILDGCVDDTINFLYVMGENPMVSDPDINHVREAFNSADFVVVQDIFLTETAEMADVILPASSFAEKDGTFTNTERRIQRVRKAIDPIGDSKPDWKILMEIMNELGYEKKYLNTASIMEEIASVTPQYGGVSYKRLEKDPMGLQWPCLDEDHPGTPILHEKAMARGRGLFMPCEYAESAELPDKDYPYTFTTGRILYHYHTRSMTGRVDGLNELAPESYVEINEVTARKLKIKDGDTVKLSSRRGEIETSARVTDIIDEEVLFMPFHYAEGAANYLTNTSLDPIAKIPELKVAAVKMEKIG